MAMKSTKYILYVPIGVPTFHRESAREIMESSSALLWDIAESFGASGEGGAGGSAAGAAWEVIEPEDILLSPSAVESFLDAAAAYMADQSSGEGAGGLAGFDNLAAFLGIGGGDRPSAIVLQNLTFANSAYAAEVLRRYCRPAPASDPDDPVVTMPGEAHAGDIPVILWAVREPVIDGGRLRLNSLTGSFSAGNLLRQFVDEPVRFVFGAPGEERTEADLRLYLTGAAADATTVVNCGGIGKPSIGDPEDADADFEQALAAGAAAAVATDLASLKLAAIGHTPEGFGFGRSTDAELLKTFGTRLVSIEARELMNKARAYSDEDIAACLAEADSAMVGLSETPEPHRSDFARLYKAYLDFVTENGIRAIASRCWPDFFTDYGTPVCAVLAMLNDRGIPASCETDVCGALSMYIGSKLSGGPVFFGDPSSMDEEENTITFWHCGTAACSLAREDTGAKVGVHCNRRIGPTMEFGCKPSDRATIFRVGKGPDGRFRFFVAGGEILDKPQQFFGTSLVVRTDDSAEELVRGAVRDGFEPHYVVIYGDVTAELKALANLFGL